MESDHAAPKRPVALMRGFRSVHSAEAMRIGVETMTSHKECGLKTLGSGVAGEPRFLTGSLPAAV